MRRPLRTLPIALLSCLLLVTSSARAQSALEAGAAPTSPVPAPLLVPTRGDAELLAAWTTWQRAFVGQQPSAAGAALKELLALKADLGAEDLETFSTALARASAARLKAEDPVAGITLASAAVELAPDLPYSHLALAAAYFRSEPVEVGRWGAALGDAVGRIFADPRYLRPALADLLGALLTALLATAGAIVLVLFARSARYFVHDFHHLFPRAAARWQTVPLAMVVLLLPVVFRLGLIPILLVLFAAATLYLAHAERIVAAVALVLVALLPLLGGWMTSTTAFAGTPAEHVYLIERGGTLAASAAEKVRVRMAEGRAGFEELFALGRYELRRGRLESASELFKKAAPLRDNDARVLTNLGNARFAFGDLEGAQSLYRQASEADPMLAAPLYNLSRVHYRRAATLTDAAEAMELEKAQTSHGNAQSLDPALLSRPDLPKDAPQPFNRLLILPGLRTEELAALASATELSDRVSDQVAWKLVGMPSGPLAWGGPVLLVLVVLGLGLLRRSLSASRACDKCGRAVCRRCDPELSLGGGLCHQCINVFARKGLVAPQEKVRKQLEVDRHQARSERLSWIFGIVCSGAGHLFAGRPIPGALFALPFFFCLSLAVFRDGLIRAPWGEVPMWLRLAPVAVVFVAVYFLSLISLRKAHTR